MTVGMLLATILLVLTCSGVLSGAWGGWGFASGRRARGCWQCSQRC